MQDYRSDRIRMNNYLLRAGQEYADVFDFIAALGLTSTFTQTGGMNAAIELALSSGRTVLITEAEDSLAWGRVAHQSWGVGLYALASEYDDGPMHFVECEAGSLQGLAPLLEEIIRHDADHPAPTKS